MRKLIKKYREALVCIMSILLLLGIVPCFAVMDVRAAVAPTATVSDVTVDGTVGSAITEREFTITLENGDFISQTDMASWLQQGNSFESCINLPEGLSLNYYGSERSNSVSFTVSGTPAAAVNEVFQITIPQELIEDAQFDVTVTENQNARWAIQEYVEPSATVSDVTVNGTVGSAITEREFTITLNGVNFVTTTKMAAWAANGGSFASCINLPAGLSVDYVDSDNSYATFKVSGMPTEAISDTFAILIPKELLVNSAVNLAVNENQNAKWAIDVASTGTTTNTSQTSSAAANPAKSPKTGESSMLLVLLLMVLAAGSAVTLFVRGRAKRY